MASNPSHGFENHSQTSRGLSDYQHSLMATWGVHGRDNTEVPFAPLTYELDGTVLQYMLWLAYGMILSRLSAVT